MKLPRLYPILDAGLLAKRGIALEIAAFAFRDAGVQILQYRDKGASDETILANAERIKKIFEGTGCKLILNDRADLAVRAKWDGVHVGQGDLSVAGARGLMGAAAVLGLSTHNMHQVREAHASVTDYIAIGPVFATGTKTDAEPVVGLEGVRLARSITDRPLVAIGGITKENAASVIAAGADAVAVVSGLLPAQGEDIRQECADFLSSLRSAQ